MGRWPRRCPSREAFDGVDNLDLPYGTGTFAIAHAEQPGTTCGFGSDRIGGRTRTSAARSEHDGRGIGSLIAGRPASVDPLPFAMASLGRTPRSASLTKTTGAGEFPR